MLTSRINIFKLFYYLRLSFCNVYEYELSKDPELFRTLLFNKPTTESILDLYPKTEKFALWISNHEHAIITDLSKYSHTKGLKLLLHVPEKSEEIDIRSYKVLEAIKNSINDWIIDALDEQIWKLQSLNSSFIGPRELKILYTKHINQCIKFISDF